MAVVHKSVFLGYSSEQMFDLVAKVEDYPKFLPWCSGVKVVEYRKTQLHAKVAVIDDKWATVGSSNCDGLSLFLNQEANVVVKDAAFSKHLRKKIELGIADGVPIKLEDYADIPWFKRAWYGAAYLAYKGIMRVITLGNYA